MTLEELYEALTAHVDELPEDGLPELNLMDQNEASKKKWLDMA